MLQDKTIVIIGGTKGLGLSAARACLRHGAKVVLVGREAESAKAVEQELGECCRAMVGDATDAVTAKDAIQLAVEQFGPLHGLYHVAGGSGRRMGDGPLHEISEIGWDYTLDLNLRSLFFSNQAACRQFLNQKTPGTILNMGSVLGYSPSPKFFATHAYAATKSAIIGLTKTCAAYYAPYDIRFNVLAPALVETPMAQRAAGDQAILNFIRYKQPLDGGRIGQPEDLDAAAVFFLSDESKFCTGQVLAVDGGWTVSDVSLRHD